MFDIWWTFFFLSFKSYNHVSKEVNKEESGIFIPKTLLILLNDILYIYIYYNAFCVVSCFMFLLHKYIFYIYFFFFRLLNFSNETLKSSLCDLPFLEPIVVNFELHKYIGDP